MYSHELDPLARNALNAWIAVRQLGWPATALSVKTHPGTDGMTVLSLTVRDGDRSVDLPIGKFTVMFTVEEIVDEFLQALKIYSSGRLVDAQAMIARFGGLDREQWERLTRRAGMPQLGPELRN